MIPLAAVTMTLISADADFTYARTAPAQKRPAMERRQGVAHVVASSRWGGMEARTLDTAQWQGEHGLDVVVVTEPNGALHREASKRGLAVEPLAFGAGDTLQNLLRMRSIFRRHNVQVADFHTNRSLAWGVWDLACLVRTQHVLRTRRSKLAFNKERPFDRFILSSNAGAEVLAQSGYARRSRIDVVGEWAGERFFGPPPSSQRRFALRQALGVPSGDFVIGAVAMLRPDNAFDAMIHATARLRAAGLPVTCLIVGGPMQPGPEPSGQELALRSLSAELGVSEHIRFLGHRDDVPELMSVMDVVGVVSRHTAQTRVAPEAAARGRPVVAFDVGALGEAVRNGRTGLLVPPQDVAAFTAAFEHLLRSPLARERMAAEAERFARRSFALDVKMEETLGVYEEALAQRRGALASPRLAPAFGRRLAA